MFLYENKINLKKNFSIIYLKRQNIKFKLINYYDFKYKQIVV